MRALVSTSCLSFSLLLLSGAAPAQQATPPRASGASGTNPATVKVEPYRPGRDRSSRAVLAELFTGTSCSRCVPVALAVNGLLERYGRLELSLLVFHQGVDGPDPMANPSTVVRARRYGVTRTPTLFIDGAVTEAEAGGGATAQEIYARLVSSIDVLLTKRNEATWSAMASLDGSRLTVSVEVEPRAYGSPDLRLQVALVENELTYAAENGLRVHPMVVRQMAGELNDGVPFTATKPFKVTFAFDLDAVSAEYAAAIGKPVHAIERTNLAIVTFVQDEKTRHVLQSGYLPVRVPRGEKPR
jgi:hypothetical protein